MPQRTIALPVMAVRGHTTAYGKLALRGLSCFAQHPLLGVGPGGFRESCRVMAMNTFGEWTDQRDSHNQLGGLLSELGLVGVALLVLAWLAWRRGYRFDAMTSWQRAIWIGLLVCGLGSEDLLTLPVLALLASQLAPRAPPGSTPTASPSLSRGQG
jgi:O-antigen ligase